MITSNDKNQQAGQSTDNSRNPENQSARQNTQQPEGLTVQDLPDSDNESTGAMGSGQRQDSN